MLRNTWTMTVASRMPQCPVIDLCQVVRLQASSSKCSLPQLVGPGSIPNAIICHTRGLQLECRRPSDANKHLVQMGLRGMTICILGDPLG